VNRLFIHLFFDENVDVLVAKILRARGYYVLTTDEAKRKGASDSAQIEFAVANEMAIATMNRGDFEELAKHYFDKGRTHFGIFLIGDNSPQQIALRLGDFLDRLTADEMIDQLVYL